MNASIVDLRYKTRKILGALERSEEVNILYHGKIRGRIVPAHGSRLQKVSDHEFFGMFSEDKRSVGEVMEELRGGRFHDL